MSLNSIAQDLRRELGPLRFGQPVAFVYNPLEYAWKAYAAYLDRFGQAPKEVVLFGMNPGPWGMAQTGVPFGEVNSVRDWMGIEAAIGKPAREHPKRLVTGFDCPRSEVSGRRVWGWAKETFGSPERFFERFFIANYCPLLFLEESGRNRTPDKLPANERKRMLQACDSALRRTVEHLRPRFVIGIGRFAEERARTALQGLETQIGTILHPSPASPLANRGWAPMARRQLAAMGIELPQPIAADNADGASGRSQPAPGSSNLGSPAPAD